MASVGDLQRVRFEKLIELTTQGRKTGRPHTVTLWFAAVDDEIFLSHEGEETDWMRNIRKNDHIFFKIRGLEFQGIAHFLDDTAAEISVAKKSLYEKYYGKATRETIDDWFSMSKLLLVRLKSSAKGCF